MRAASVCWSKTNNTALTMLEAQKPMKPHLRHERSADAKTTLSTDNVVSAGNHQTGARTI